MRIHKIESILRIVCNCHGIPERCFKVNGHTFPVCARCTGVLLGYLVAIVMNIVGINVSNIINVLLIVPMIVDGYMQYFKGYNSNNTRRFITGLLFGVAFIYLFIYPLKLAYAFGVNIRNGR